jgi:peptide/nickel transport system ATP-binding protein
MFQPGCENLLEVHNLKMYFPITRGLLKRKVADVKAVDDVSFNLKRGETLGLVGESGCGKTTVGRCVIRLYQPTSSKIIFDGVDISILPERQIRPLRRKIALIFQDPYSSLDPRHSAEHIVGEPLKVHRMFKSQAEYKQKVSELLTKVGLDPSMGNRFPHEFSGGQRQRIGIARALACEPNLVVCDEPISALDVSIQAQIINLLQELQSEFKDLSYIFIAHDLSVVKHISHRIAVMYLGRIVEITRPKELYENPLHPYTKALISAIPVPDPYVEETRERLIIKGEVPSPINPPSGCSFHARCYMAKPECSQNIPTLKEMGHGHEVACFRA